MEPDEFLRSVNLLHGGTAARPTGTDKPRRARSKDNGCYEILKEAKAASWSPSADIKAFLPVTAGEVSRQIGGMQAETTGKFVQCRRCNDWST